MKEANFRQSYIQFSLINHYNSNGESADDFDFGNSIYREVMTYDENFTYGHYKVNSGVGTVAGFRIGNKLYFGVSLCSPNDNFSKASGRERAEDNLIYAGSCNKRGVMILDENTKDLHPTELLKLALEHHLNKMAHKPIWVKNPVVDFRPKNRKNNV